MNKPFMTYKEEADSLRDQLAAAQVRVDAIGEASLNAQARFQQREKELIAHIEAWKHTAEQHLRNEQFYQGLLDDCAFHLGPETFISDDGSVQDSPIRLKIPEMVAALLAHIERLRKVITTARSFSEGGKKLAREALAATPAQSLAKYHNKILEKAANKCEPTIWADVIRAMKEPE